MTKKLPAHEKENRKPISRACSFCHAKHIQCDHARPCKNCLKRGLQDSCRDVERKKAKYLNGEEKNSKKRTAAAAAALSQEYKEPVPKRPSLTEPLAPKPMSDPSVVPSPIHHITTPTRPSSIAPPTSASSSLTMPRLTDNAPFMNMAHHHLDSITPVGGVGSPAASSRQGSTPKTIPQANNRPGNIHQQMMSQDYESSPDAFSSLFANQEYAQLADLLDNNMVHSPSQSSVHTSTNYFNNEFQTSFQSENNTRPYISVSDNTNNPVSSIAEDEAVISHSLMNEKQEPFYTSPLILRHLIQQPEDVYTTRIQPYNYPMAYHVLLNYLKTRFKKQQLIEIAETMAEYRPSFIAATRSLVEMDLLFAERSFQRSLLEYESMSSLSSSPTIMWRRSGEIVAVSTEFSSLTAHTKTELLSKRTFIVELMNDSSALDYFKLFSSVAFGDLNGVIITECTLLSPSGQEIRCASTWTVKRDVFDIPMLVVGQFLPILQVR